MAKPMVCHDWAQVRTNIDRRTFGSRIVPMRVMMLGLGRTGTESTVKALERLGVYKTYHGWDPIFGNPCEAEMWLEALAAKYEGKGKPYGKEEFDKLLGHCQGVSDFPAILFTEELIAAYPDAKVILTHRDFDSWYKSVSESIEFVMSDQVNFGALKWLLVLLRRHDRYVRFCTQKSWHILFDGDYKANARKVWDRQYDLVRSLVPSDQLLEYDVKQGWDPLVKFLGVEHPGIPFPASNSGEDLYLRTIGEFKHTCKEIGWTLLNGAVWAGFSYIVMRRALQKAKDAGLLSRITGSLNY